MERAGKGRKRVGREGSCGKSWVGHIERDVGKNWEETVNDSGQQFIL